MATFEVLVRTIDEVIDHPNADRLSICKILGYDAITAKIEGEDGVLRHRFQKGEAVVFVPEAAVVPEALLRQYGYWDEEKGKGMLAGKAGDRVKPIKLRQIFSIGLVWPVEKATTRLPDAPETETPTLFVRKGEWADATLLAVKVGDDVAEFFGITKYEPPIPAGMGGEVAAVYEFRFDYDIENWQNFPGFLDDDEVEAVEKGHGTHCRVSYRPNVSHEDMFGEGDVAIASKGLGAKGLVFKNNEKNASNLYVRMAVENGLIDKVRSLGVELGKSVDLFGEVFGPGVQWLHYGQKKPKFAAFDIAIDGVFLGADEKAQMLARVGIERLPVLYRGPWDEAALIAVRDGKTTIAGDHIREGVVVTATGLQEKREINGHRLRPILKMISPAYALKQTGEEIQ